MSPFTASVQRRIADQFFANTNRSDLRLEEIPSDQEQVVEWLCERGAWWTEMSPERRREHVRTLASPLRVSDEEADRLVAQADRRVSGEETINARVEESWVEEPPQLVAAEPSTPNGSRVRQLPLSAFVPGDADEFQVRVVADIRMDVAPGAYEMTFLVVGCRSVPPGWVTPCLRLAAWSTEGVVEALDELLGSLKARSWPDLVAKLRGFTTPPAR